MDDALVLATWSSGSGAPSPVLPLLALAEPSLGPDERAALPVDRANRSLLAAMAELGERALDALVTCPSCDEPNEVVLPLDVLLAADDASADGEPVPSVADLESARALADPAAAERLLVDRCVGDQDREALAARLDERHPLLAPRVQVACAACGDTFSAGLDVADLAWASVSAAAARLLDDVAHLARGYGWSEAEVLALPRVRRAVYRRLLDDGLV